MEDFLIPKKEETLQERLQREALAATVKVMQEKISTLVCPIHQQNPKLKFSEDSGSGEEKMSFDCCCDTLAKMLPRAAASYEQVLRDIAEGGRVSWRGTSAELIEALREVMDHLAPDDKVSAAPGFQLETGQTGPTQRQKVRFILKARGSRGTAVAEGSLAIDEAVASLARSAYQRGSVSTHAAPDVSEVRKLKRYVDALLAELLEIA